MLSSDTAAILSARHRGAEPIRPTAHRHNPGCEPLSALHITRQNGHGNDHRSHTCSPRCLQSARRRWPSTGRWLYAQAELRADAGRTVGRRRSSRAYLRGGLTLQHRTGYSDDWFNTGQAGVTLGPSPHAAPESRSRASRPAPRAASGSSNGRHICRVVPSRASTAPNDSTPSRVGAGCARLSVLRQRMGAPVRAGRRRRRLRSDADSQRTCPQASTPASAASRLSSADEIREGTETTDAAQACCWAAARSCMSRRACSSGRTVDLPTAERGRHLALRAGVGVDF